LHDRFCKSISGDEYIANDSRYSGFDDGKISDGMAYVEAQVSEPFFLGVSIGDIFESERVHVDNSGLEASSFENLDAVLHRVPLSGDKHGLFLFLPFFDYLT